MRWIYQDLIGEFQQLVVQTFVEHARQLRRRVFLRQVRPAHIPQKKRVAGQHSPWIRGLCMIGDDQANTFQSVARSLEHTNGQLAYAQLESVTDRNVRKCRSCFPSDIDLRPSASRQLLMSRHKVCMKMGFENVSNGNPVLFRSFEVYLDIALGVDD